MPTSAPGSSTRRFLRAPCRGRAGRGFTLIELLVVMALVAVTVGVIVLALPDTTAVRLEREGERLAALLESARAEARASGLAASWVPSRESGGEQHFRFVGMPETRHLPTRWLDERTVAQIEGARAVVLGPEPMLPPQRVRLQLEGFVLDVASDGLQPFTPGGAAPAAGGAT